MNELRRAKEMLAQAIANERAAKQALERSKRDRERAEQLVARSSHVTRELRRHRENNHFTDTFKTLFGGGPQ